MAKKANTEGQALPDAEQSQPQNTPLKADSIVPAVDPVSLDTVKLQPGHVLLASIGENGREGKPFVVSGSTYRKYYADETKFVVKKKQ